MVFAFLDPEGAEKKGKELLQKMDTAKRVHVISTRYQKEASMMERDKGKGRGSNRAIRSCRPTRRSITSRWPAMASSSSSTPTETMPF